MKKRFLLFSWMGWEAMGGFNDLDGNYDTIEECEEKIKSYYDVVSGKTSYYYQVYDQECKEIVLKG